MQIPGAGNIPETVLEPAPKQLGSARFTMWPDVPGTYRRPAVRGKKQRANSNAVSWASFGENLETNRAMHDHGGVSGPPAFQVSWGEFCP